MGIHGGSDWQVQAIIGLCIFAVGIALLWKGLRPDGSLPSRFPFPRAVRDNPITFWASAIGIAGVAACGLYIAVAAIMGWPAQVPFLL